MLRKLTLFVVVSLSMLSLISCQQRIDIEAEKEAIKTVIENETKYAYACNMEEFEKTWAHEPYTLFTLVDKNRHLEIVGWDSLSQFIKPFFGNNPPLEEEVIRLNYNIRVYGKGAWATFEQYNKSDKEINPDHIPGRSLRVLEKTEEGWKIIFMGGIGKDSYVTNQLAHKRM